MGRNLKKVKEIEEKSEAMRLSSLNFASLAKELRKKEESWF
jgi:hypothetical protein